MSRIAEARISSGAIAVNAEFHFVLRRKGKDHASGVAEDTKGSLRRAYVPAPPSEVKLITEQTFGYDLRHADQHF